MTNTEKLCKKCGIAKSTAEFYKKRDRGLERLHDKCKQCMKDAANAWHRANPDRVREKRRRRMLKNPTRSWWLSLEEVAAMPDACEICGSRFRLAIDHDHATRTLRGRLCFRCNVGIGYFHESEDLLSRAILYLRGDVGKWELRGEPYGKEARIARQQRKASGG